VYYAWLTELMEAGKSRLAAETIRDATQARSRGLKQQNERLKQLVVELSTRGAGPHGHPRSSVKAADTHD
jgi:hypothetical protein